MPYTEADHAKQAVRHRIWTLLEQEGVSPPGAYGNIPWFTGSDQAAARLAAAEIWRRAKVIKSNPDGAQFSVRLQALQDGKLLYLAVPRIATVRPFYKLDPTTMPRPFEDLATAQGAARVAPTVKPDEMRRVDLIVAGSVAVNRDGVRIGKGAGYSDIEVALLIEAGLVGPNTAIVTTVHGMQVVYEHLPETEHDFSVDFIVTPDEIIECPLPRRPDGICCPTSPRKRSNRSRYCADERIRLYREHGASKRVAALPGNSAKKSPGGTVGALLRPVAEVPGPAFWPADKETKTGEARRIVLDPTRRSCWPSIASGGSSAARCWAANLPQMPSCSPPPQTPRHRSFQGRSSSDTAGWQSGSSSAAPGFTRCGTIPPRNCWQRMSRIAEGDREAARSVLVARRPVW